jgi:uncharacterized protein (TIGR02246 family)
MICLSYINVIMETSFDKSSISRAAILSLYNRLIQFWNDCNCDDFANLFAVNGSLIGFDGSQANGREDIREHLSSIFCDHGPARFITMIQETRILSNDTVLLRAVAGMMMPGTSTIIPHFNSIQSLIATREHGEFKISLFQNTPAAFNHHPELVAQLTTALEKRAN